MPATLAACCWFSIVRLKKGDGLSKLVVMSVVAAAIPRHDNQIVSTVLKAHAMMMYVRKPRCRI